MSGGRIHKPTHPLEATYDSSVRGDTGGKGWGTGEQGGDDQEPVVSGLRIRGRMLKG